MDVRLVQESNESRGESGNRSRRGENSRVIHC